MKSQSSGCSDKGSCYFFCENGCYAHCYGSCDSSCIASSN
jgi:hypothetical protein